MTPRRTPNNLRSMVDRTRRELVAAYPKAFADRKEGKRPLVAGVREQLLSSPSLKHIKRFALLTALNDYCTGPTYLTNMVEGAPRIDLQGRRVSTVTLQHENYARYLMRRLWPVLPARFLTMIDGSPIEGIRELPPKAPATQVRIKPYAAERRPYDYGTEMPCREVIPGMACLEHDPHEFCR